MSKPDSAAWTAAKHAGDVTENYVARLLRSRGADVLKYMGASKADLEARFIIECKHDLQAPASGRVALETAYDGKPSGLHATTAGQWFIHVGNELYWVSVEKLREAALTRGYKAVQAGDRRRATVLLMPLGDLRAMSRLVVPVEGIP